MTDETQKTMDFPKPLNLTVRMAPGVLAHLDSLLRPAQTRQSRIREIILATPAETKQ